MRLWCRMRKFSKHFRFLDDWLLAGYSTPECSPEWSFPRVAFRKCVPLPADDAQGYWAPLRAPVRCWACCNGKCIFPHVLKHTHGLCLKRERLRPTRGNINIYMFTPSRANNDDDGTYPLAVVHSLPTRFVPLQVQVTSVCTWHREKPKL